MNNNIADELRKLYPFNPVKSDEFKSFKVSGMKFVTEGYEVPGLGHVSLMNASGMLGLMKMESVIINPFDVDMPLLSIDRIKAMGNDSLYMELYDTLLNEKRQEEPFKAVKEKYGMLKDIDQTPKWYDQIRYDCSVLKKGTKKETAVIDRCIREYGEAYLELLKKAPRCEREAKKEKAHAYSDGLINNGGPATDAFLKSWGREKTAEYFAKVLFG